MQEDDFDIDSLMGEVKDSGAASKKKRRVIDEANENFNFDIDDRATTISNNDEVKNYNPEQLGAEKAKQTSAEEKSGKATGDSEKNNKEKSKEKKQVQGSKKNKKGKRISELNELDFEGLTEEEIKNSEGDSKKGNSSKGKNKNKRRIMNNNEFDVLEDELEKIHEIQNQIKANKLNAIALTKEEEEEKVKQRINILVRVIIFLLLLLIIAFSFIVIKYNGMLADQKRIKIAQSEATTNAANYIYVDVPIQFEDSVVKITKIRLDSQELAIYLDTPINFDKYQFHVIDDNLNRHYNTTNIEQKVTRGHDTELTFDPLEVGTEKFSLKVENIESGYNTETIFELEEPVIYPSVKFYYNANTENETLYVQSTVFSSAFTKSSVIAKGTEQDVRFISEENIEKGNLYIKNKGVSVPLEPGEAEYAYFDEFETGISIIRNAPLNTLTGSVEYGAEKIYRQKTVEMQLDIVSLNLGHKLRDNVDSNAIVVEGIYNYDGTIVMPMNGRKENAIPSNPVVYYEVGQSGKSTKKVIESSDNKNFDKISVTMDATLYATDEDGNEFTVEADSRIGEDGSDVIFSDSRLKGKELNEIEIVIHDFVTVEPGISKVTNLDYTQSTQKSNDLDFQAVTRESFLSRLKYKSRELTRSYVQGFESDMVTNFDIDEIYAPIETSTSAYYSTFIDGFVSENNRYYAIVEEEWIARDKNGSIIKMRNKHKIIAEKQGRNYIIIYDKIME